MSFIDIVDLVKEYGSRKLLDRISISVEKGDILIIEGPSGIGKTTLLNIIAGIDTPVDGEVIIDGTKIFDLSEDKRARFRLEKIGIVFQQMNLIEDLNVMENIALPLKLAGKKWKERVDELLKYMKIEDLKYEMPQTLSGGEMQRCAIARALANEPEILIADEPTSNLDDDNTRNIADLILRINEEMGTTIIIATHDPRIHYLGKRRLVLDGGKIYER